MTMLEILKKHYVGKRIISGDVHPNHYGKKIINLGVDHWDKTLYFVVEGDGAVVTFSFYSNIEVK